MGIDYTLPKNPKFKARNLKKRFRKFRNKLGSINIKDVKKNIKFSSSKIIIIFLTIFLLAGSSYAAFDYHKISNLIKEAEEFTKKENHKEAIEKLTVAQVSWFVKNLGIRKEKIDDEIKENEQMFIDKEIYDKALLKINEKSYQNAILILLDLPESSYYYQDAQIKIGESEKTILEGELFKEKVARKEAEGIAKEEAIKRAQEETARKIAEEETAREAAARKEAEQRALNERLAKEQQQREAEIQRQRADQEEKDRILELAKTHPLIQAIVSGELKFYIDSLPSYAATGVLDAVESIASSFSSWNPYGASVRRVYNSNDADLAVYWIRDYGSYTIGEAIYRAHVKVGLGKNNCTGDWSAFDANTVKKILWHELGHSMGYGHSSNSNNVMYSQLATRFEIDREISKVISGGWYSTILLCGAGTYSYSFKTDSFYEKFDLFVLPPDQDAYEISGGSGLYYSDCSAENTYSYSDSCIVDNGAKIYIGNTSFSDAIRISGKIIDMNDRPWPDMDWDENAFFYDQNQLMEYWELFH